MINEIIKKFGQCIRIYIGKETITDPFEKTVDVVLLPPYPIKGIVNDLVASQIQWKIPGIVAEKAKDIMVNKSNRALLEKSYKISIKENNEWVDYKGWKVNGKMQIREYEDGLRLYIYNI